MPLIRNPRTLRLLLLAAGSGSVVATTIGPSLDAVAVGDPAGGLVMEESVLTPDGWRVACVSSSTGGSTASCGSVNLYGDAGADRALVPGGEAHSTAVTISNAGTRSANGLTITAGPCRSDPSPGATDSGTGDLCEVLRIRISAGPTVMYDGTASSLAGQVVDLLAGPGQAGPVRAGTGRTYVFEAWIRSTAGQASYRGLEVHQSLSWQFTP